MGRRRGFDMKVENEKIFGIIMCMFAALLASMRIIAAPAALVWEMTGLEVSSSLSNTALRCLLPAVTSGVLLLTISGKLEFWFSNLLCLGSVFLYAMLHVIFAPMVMAVMNSESYAISLASFWPYFLEASMYYVFPVYFIMLLFYGVSCKKRIVSAVAAIWSLGHGILLPLLPLLYDVLGEFGTASGTGFMDREFLRNLLAVLAALALIVLSFRDLKHL